MFELRLIISLGTAILMVVSFAGCASNGKAASCTKAEISLDAGLDVTSFRPTPSQNRSVIVIPPTGRTNVIDRSYAKQLCDAGFDAYIMNRWNDDEGTETDLEIHQGFYTRMLKAVDFLLAKIDTPYVGVLGTSLGGLYAAVAGAKIERIDAIFVIVAGAPIADIIVTSDQKAMRNLAETRRLRFSLNSDQKYREALGNAFRLEPMSQVPLMKKKHYGMIIAEKDTTVPTEYQHRLKEYWKPETSISLNLGHFWAIIHSWIRYDDDIVAFFERTSAH